MNQHQGADQRRGSSEQRRGSSDQRRGSSDERRGSSDRRRGSSEQRRGSTDQQHGSSDKHHDTPDKHHGTPDKHHGTPDKHHGTPDKHHGSSDKHHGSSDTHHGPSDKHHGSSDRHHGSSDKHHDFPDPRYGYTDHHRGSMDRQHGSLGSHHGSMDYRLGSMDHRYDHLPGQRESEDVRSREPESPTKETHHDRWVNFGSIAHYLSQGHRGTLGNYGPAPTPLPQPYPALSPISHVPEHLKPFVMEAAPPFYTPLSARWKQSYAYATTVMRMGIILDMTLEQFRVDMENLLEEEAQAEEDASMNGEFYMDGFCCESLLDECCDSQESCIEDDTIMSLNINGLPDLNVGGIGPEGLHICSVGPRRPLRWICTPPAMDYSFLDSEVSDMALGIKLWVFKAAGLKLDRKVPPKIKSDRDLRSKHRNGSSESIEMGDHKRSPNGDRRSSMQGPNGMNRHGNGGPPNGGYGTQKNGFNGRQFNGDNGKFQNGNGKCASEENIGPCDPRYKEKVPIEDEDDEEESLYDDPRFEEWNNVERAIMELKEEVTKNKWFKLFHTMAPDGAAWNHFLKQRAIQERTPKLRWICTVWVYAESYLFRRIQEIFETTESLCTYDPFRKMKEKSFYKTVEGMDKVAIDFLKMITLCPLPKPDHDTTGQYLHMLLTLSLWGNRTDLMEGGPTSVRSDFTGGNPLLRALTFGTSLLVDQMDCVWTTLLDKKLNENRRVDIITDNAGFEIFADMLLADFLLTFRLVDRVHFHVKAIPWFISDVTRYDLYRTIELMAEVRKVSVPLALLAERWVDYIACGQWVVEDDYFWTLPYCYDEMRCMDGPLYAKLLHSSLLIFKGDLNYRKLLGDVNWEPSVSFKTALRNFRPTNLIALRTFKSDLICGVPLSTGMYMQIPKGWMLTGKFAVAQFARRKKCIPGLPGPP